MKLYYKGLTLLSVMVFSACSTNPDTMFPQAVRQTYSNSIRYEEESIRAIQKDDAFISFNNQLQKFENKIKSRKIFLRLTDQAQVTKWQQRHSFDTEADVRKALAEITNDPDALLALSQSFTKHWNLSRLRQQVPTLRPLKDDEVAALFTQAMAKGRKPKVGDVNLSSECLGMCSANYNIAQETAYNSALVAAAGCGWSFATIAGALGCGVIVMAAYGVAINSALQSLDQCAIGCNLY